MYQFLENEIVILATILQIFLKYTKINLQNLIEVTE